MVGLPDLQPKLTAKGFLLAPASTLCSPALPVGPSCNARSSWASAPECPQGSIRAAQAQGVLGLLHCSPLTSCPVLSVLCSQPPALVLGGGDFPPIVRQRKLRVRNIIKMQPVQVAELVGGSAEPQTDLCSQNPVTGGQRGAGGQGTQMTSSLP